MRNGPQLGRLLLNPTARFAATRLLERSVDQDGTVRNGSGSSIGKVESDGTVAMAPGARSLALTPMAQRNGSGLGGADRLRWHGAQRLAARGRFDGYGPHVPAGGDGVPALSDRHHNDILDVHGELARGYAAREDRRSNLAALADARTNIKPAQRLAVEPSSRVVRTSSDRVGEQRGAHRSVDANPARSIPPLQLHAGVRARYVAGEAQVRRVDVSEPHRELLEPAEASSEAAAQQRTPVAERDAVLVAVDVVLSPLRSDR